MLKTEAGVQRVRVMVGWVVFLGLLGAVMALTGCSTAGVSVSGSHAGVTITGQGVTDVVLTTREVFNEHGFTLTGAETDRMIFERPGTTAEQIKYGSFGSTAVVIRAKIDIQDMGTDVFYLRCDLFSVRDAGQSVLEDETRLVLASSKSYQAMLDEVKVRLEGPPAADQ